MFGTDFAVDEFLSIFIANIRILFRQDIYHITHNRTRFEAVLKTDAPSGVILLTANSKLPSQYLNNNRISLQQVRVSKN